VELDAVAHGDHGFAAVVVEAGVRWCEDFGRLTRKGRGGGLRRVLGGEDGEEGAENSGDEQTSAEQKRGHMFPFHGGDSSDAGLSACLGRCQSADGIICGDWAEPCWILFFSVTNAPRGYPLCRVFRELLWIQWLVKIDPCKIVQTKGLSLKSSS